MTTKVIKAAFNYADREELPRKSLEQAIDVLKNNEDVQKKLKDMVCFCVSIEGGQAACNVTMKFISKEVAAANTPDQQIKNALAALADTILRSLMEDAKKEDNND